MYGGHLGGDDDEGLFSALLRLHDVDESIDLLLDGVLQDLNLLRLYRPRRYEDVPHPLLG